MPALDCLLKEQFRSARLELELRSVPLAWDRFENAEAIVQIDIAQDAERRRPERFRIYPGHDENRIEVLDSDRALAQLVMLVDEPARAFRVFAANARRVPHGATIVRTDRSGVWYEESTSGRMRHFLCGMDEQHLFIALLPDPATTVAGAHESLRDPRVGEAEAIAGSVAIRQGEWFFVPLCQEDQAAVTRLAKKSLPVQRSRGIAEVAGIARLGRAHVADEIVIVEGIADRSGDRSRRIYVRGAIKHPDHRTLVLDAWHQTIVNREQIERPVEGVDWID